MPERAFFAFPSGHSLLSTSIDECIEKAAVKGIEITPWPTLHHQGLRIDQLIRDRMLAADFLVADITYPNFNVYYEIGYALGSAKPVLPTVNSAISHATSNVNLTGLFDTFGQIRYENADELADQLVSSEKRSWSNSFVKDKDHSQPLYVVEPIKKLDFIGFILQSIANSALEYRRFDPDETPRLYASSAVAEISSSSGVILPLISTEVEGYLPHNLHCAFMAGLCHAMQIDPLIIQYEDQPAPLDYREFVDTARTRLEVQSSVEEYCQQTLINNQRRGARTRRLRTLLEKIDLGSSAAENEHLKLDLYFISTAEYARALRASGAVVVGRKGAGKSAIFFSVMSKRMEDKRNLVVELNPAMHQLSLLREKLLEVVTAGVFDHTIAAFWQLILYTEILLKIREVLLPKAKYDFRLLEEIRLIEEQFSLTDEIVAGDFTSRLDAAINRVIKRIDECPPGKNLREYLTNILFEDQIPALREKIVSLGTPFRAIVILFDNIDKGWPPRGVEEHDVRTIGHLLETLKRLERDLGRRNCEIQHLLFLRSDVHDRLVEETSDRGKYNPVYVDWSDAEQLERLIKERVWSNLQASERNDVWSAVNPVLASGQTAVQAMIGSSLMRPRFLIDLCEKAISLAINRGHTSVGQSDVEDALSQHSNYLVSYFGYELRDVHGIPHKTFYRFKGQSDTLTKGELADILKDLGTGMTLEQLIQMFLWYGFLGLPTEHGAVYIYDLRYDMMAMEAEHERQGADVLYIINPAFVRGLESRH